MSKSENMPVRKIGYVRVSTSDQNPDMQIQALKDYGVDEALIFVDRASGGTLHRPNFLRALRYAQHPGTEFVVWKTDRLARTMAGAIEVLNILERRGVMYFSLTERVDFTSPMGRFILQIMAATAEMERNLIIERTNAGIARARARGEKGGRPVAMTVDRVEVADMMLRAGKRGQEVFDAVKKLSDVPLSRAAYYAFQKRWDAGEVETIFDGDADDES